MNMHPLARVLLFIVTVSACSCSHQGYTPLQAYKRSHPSDYAPSYYLPDDNQPRNYFTVGSTMDEVAAIMGTPDRIQEFVTETWWNYGSSRVEFRRGQVTGWDNRGGNLKVSWSDETPPLASSPPSEQSMRAIQPRPPNPEEKAIAAKVAAIMAAPHNPLPPAQPVRTNPRSTVAEVLIENSTRYNLTVLYSGPTTQSIQLPPNGSQRVQLAVGQYQVAASVDSPSVRPFAGTDNLGGGSYATPYFITTTRY